MKQERLIEKLYDMALEKDDRGLNKFDEAKLRRALESNDKLMKKNKDIFKEGEPNFYKCKMYDPCPLCDKCRNKASHLYIQCQNCQIPTCMHTQSNKELMLKRKNFALKVSKSSIEALRKAADEVK